MRKLRFLFAWLFMLAAMPVFVACKGDKPTKDTSGDNTNDAETETVAEAEAVDLGLSIQWAACNLGAENPWEFGDYYAWGETEPKKKYDWSTYKWCNGTDDSLTKYNVSKDYGTVDNKLTLDLADDAAHAKLGGSWRMPTLSEIKELINKCTWKWVEEYHGTNGYIVTGPNGNTIFLPAAGYREDHYSFSIGDGRYGFYWSSTLEDDFTPRNAYDLGFISHNVSGNYGENRSEGRSVRPVRQ